MAGNSQRCHIKVNTTSHKLTQRLEAQSLWRQEILLKGFYTWFDLTDVLSDVRLKTNVKQPINIWFTTWYEWANQPCPGSSTTWKKENSTLDIQTIHQSVFGSLSVRNLTAHIYKAFIAKASAIWTSLNLSKPHCAST